MFVACEYPAPKSTPATPTASAAAKAPVEQLVRKVVPAENAEDKRLIVLLHGYGSNEDDLLSLGRRLGFQGEMVSFRAPQTAGRGYAWFPINFKPGGVRYQPNDVNEPLLQLAENIRTLNTDDRKVVVAGFSQGAMMSMLLAVEHPDVVDAAVAFSGALPRTPIANGVPAPIFQAHGDADNVVTIERARDAATALKRVSERVKYQEYPGVKHTISKFAVRDAKTFLADL